MVVVSVPRLAVNIGGHVSDVLLSKAFPSLHLHSVCKRGGDSNPVRWYQRSRQVN